MRIAIASGKGGTGKTMLAVNLAVALAGEGPVGLLDCDVEEPNCHLYLKPSFEISEAVKTLVPAFDEEACTGCGLCAGACEFNALVALRGVPLFLPEMCHACGVCTFVCPEEAVSETTREVGLVGAGEVDGVSLCWGRVHVGEARSTPVIREVKDLGAALPVETVIMDSPPGVACPAVETLRGADFALLVTEPTPFGLHDLVLAVEATRQLSLPFGVVLNRVGIGDSRVESFCAAEDIDILLEIPDDRRIAEACSRGEAFSAGDDAFASRLRAFASNLRERVRTPETETGAEATGTARSEVRPGAERMIRA